MISRRQLPAAHHSRTPSGNFGQDIKHDAENIVRVLSSLTFDILHDGSLTNISLYDYTKAVTKLARKSLIELIQGTTPDLIVSRERYACSHNPCCLYCVHDNPLMTYSEASMAALSTTRLKQSDARLLSEFVGRVYESKIEMSNHLATSPIFPFPEASGPATSTCVLLSTLSSAIRLASTGWSYWSERSKMPCWAINGDSHLPTEPRAILRFRDVEQAKAQYGYCTSTTFRTYIFTKNDMSHIIIRIISGSGCDLPCAFVHKYVNKSCRSMNLINVFENLNSDGTIPQAPLARRHTAESSSNEIKSVLQSYVSSTGESCRILGRVKAEVSGKIC